MNTLLIMVLGIITQVNIEILALSLVEKLTLPRLNPPSLFLSLVVSFALPQLPRAWNGLGLS